MARPPSSGAALVEERVAPPEDRPAAPARAPDAGAPAGTQPRSRWVVPALLLVLLAPLLVALAALRQPRWFPILDLAMTELRLRDVGTADTPLIGLPGRIGVLGAEQGSHPRPLSFWSLAPTYRLLGSTAWAMEAATVVLHAVALATALWGAQRRGGARLALGLAAVLAVLIRGYGTGMLTEPWNPYMPLLWWVVLLVAAWSILDGDLVYLPIAVFAASLCAQTHAPYLGLAGGIGLLCLAGAVRLAMAEHRGGGGGRAWRWMAGSAVLGAALWAAPVLDQLTVEPGNIDLLVEHFGDPPEEGVGLGKGVEMTLLHLDPWRLATGQDAATGSLVDASQAPVGNLLPGAVVLLAWAGAVAAAWRRRHLLLLRLHLVVGVALVLAVTSISRIFGQLWYYLMIWAWGIAALLIFATVWSYAAEVAQRLGDRRVPAARRAGAVAVAAVTAASTLAFAVDATDAEVPALPLSRTMAVLVPPTTAALERGDIVGDGRDGRYLVTWSDALYIGSQGIALVNELERAGFDVGAIEPWGVPVGRHRVLDPSDATAVVHLATGFHVERWRAKPDVEEVAYVDPRSADERVEYEQLRALVIRELRRVGLDERLVDVDENLFAVAIDSRVPKVAQDAMTRMLDLGLPTAVFVAPVDRMD